MSLSQKHVHPTPPFPVFYFPSLRFLPPPLAVENQHLVAIVEPPRASVAAPSNTITTNEFGGPLSAAGHDHLSADALGAAGNRLEDDVRSAVAHADLRAVGAADFGAWGAAG